jgi:hypothetical protein
MYQNRYKPNDKNPNDKNNDDLNDLINNFNITLEDYDEYSILEKECHININDIHLYDIQSCILNTTKRYKRYIMNINWGEYNYIENEMIDWLNLQENTYEQIKYKLNKMNEINKKIFKIVCLFIN